MTNVPVKAAHVLWLEKLEIEGKNNTKRRQRQIS